MREGNSKQIARSTQAATIARANIILQQLGGARFKVMTGAKDFLALNGTGLQFRIPASKGINRVRIVLDPSDTYTMSFSFVRSINHYPKGEISGVYAEDLQRLFTEYTGLDTRL